LPWSRFTMAIAYATEAQLFISDLNQSPFNVGTRVPLRDFTRAEVADLNARYHSPLRDDVEIDRFTALLGGQPYLAHRGIHEMVVSRLTLADLEAAAERENGIFSDHLRRLLVLLAGDADLQESVREVRRG